MKQFKNKKILVTGGAGFIGSHLTKRLVKVKAKVSVIVKYNSIIDCPRLVGIWNKIKIIEADLRNIDSVNAIRNMKFDYVFHFAAQAGVRYSLINPKTYIENNISGFFNVLNLSLEFNIKRLFYKKIAGIRCKNFNSLKKRHLLS